MTAYDRAFAAIVGEEGGYVNDSRDPGGATNYGISKRAYPTEDIEDMTLERAKFLYRRDYWEAVRADELPWAWALLAFDCAVNQGVGTAARLMQDALGVMVDGKIGSRTIAAAQGRDNRALARFMALRALRYTKTNGFDVFGYGWLTRTYVMAMEAK